MESRRVVLLTEGYLHGWLTFENKTRYSELREDYILSVLEKRFIVEAAKVKLDTISSIVSGAPNRSNINSLSKDLKQYFELALPYMSEKSRIKSSNGVDQINDPAFWRKVLDKKQAELNTKVSTEAEEEKYIPVTPTSYE